MLEDSFVLKCIVFSVGMFVWLVFIGIDLLIFVGFLLWGVLVVCFGVLVLLLVCGCLIMLCWYIQLMVLLSIVCVFVFGVGVVVVVGLVYWVDFGYFYEGLLLVSFVVYFFVGLWLLQVLSCVLVVLFVYLGFEWWVGIQELLGNNLLFLLFGNLIGVVGCYLLEFKLCEYFFISCLLWVMVDYDSLIGLYNWCSFNQYFDCFWCQVQCEQKILVLLFCDVDYFKVYNDCYGYQVGDVVLQCIGVVFEVNVRCLLDMVVCLGGEEFVLLLYGVNEYEVRLCVEVLCVQVQVLCMEYEVLDMVCEVILLVGVFCLWLILGNDLKCFYDFYEYVDCVFYEVKVFGCNQVVV